MVNKAFVRNFHIWRSLVSIFKNVSKNDEASSENVLQKMTKQVWLNDAGRRTKFALVKSLWFSELFLRILLSKFCFTVFVPLGCGVDSGIRLLQFFQTAKGKAPKEAWGGHLSGGGINVTFLHPYELQLSTMRCVALNQIDVSYMICVWSFVVLCPHHSTLSSPLPFRYDKISRKGRVFRSFVQGGFMRKLFVV